MKSSHLGPLIALSALAVSPSIAFAQESASTPVASLSVATTPEPAPSLTTAPSASTPADPAVASTPGSTPVDTTPSAADPDIQDVTGALKGESKRRADRRKAAEDQGGHDPAPTSQATDPTLVDPSLLNVTAVPNFFIQDFDIPPFLLPIYQAAGSEYGIRWEVLAGINKVETDYGRNLNVSSAGALGWMQFMPSTWAQYGVDADGNGVKDPFNPADAIFAAARYLKAAGGDVNIEKGVFAYNHADWYVQEVLDNARAVAAIPDSLITSLTGLTQGIFPVAGATKNIDYAGKTTTSTDTVDAGNAADPVEGKSTRNSIEISSDPDSKVVAVQDGVVEKVGETDKLGKFVRLRDSYGNRYLYAHLGEIQDKVPVPKPVKADKSTSADESESSGDQTTGADSTSTIATDPAPSLPATAGTTPTDPAATPAPDAAAAATSATDPTDVAPTSPATTTPATGTLATTPAAAIPAATTRTRLGSTGDTGQAEQTQKNAAETPRRIRFRARDAVAAPNTPAQPAETQAARLYAHPERPEAYIAGGAEQINPSLDNPSTDEAPVGELSKYFSIDYGLKASDVTLKDLKAGQKVIAGTVLGKTGAADVIGGTSKVSFQIRPAGKSAPRIDPSPILDGWRLSDKTNFFSQQAKRAIETGTDSSDPTVGQILLMGKQELQTRVLADKRISIYACGRRDIESGQIDQRILALLEVLATKDMTPVVTALKCGHGLMTSSGNVSEHSYGDAVDIGSVYGTVIAPGTQGPGSVTDKAIREILKLQGNMKPHQIISLMTYVGYDNTLSLPDHYNHIHVGYAPTDGASSKQLQQLLKPGQWGALVKQLGTLKVPNVSAAPSKYAVTATTPAKTK